MGRAADGRCEQLQERRRWGGGEVNKRTLDSNKRGVEEEGGEREGGRRGKRGEEGEVAQGQRVGGEI